MTLTEPQIKKFQEIYFKRYGVALSPDKALESGVKLVHLMKIIIKIENNEYRKN